MKITSEEISFWDAVFVARTNRGDGSDMASLRADDATKARRHRIKAPEAPVQSRRNVPRSPE